MSIQTAELIRPNFGFELVGYGATTMTRSFFETLVKLMRLAAKSRVYGKTKAYAMNDPRNGESQCI